MDEPISPVTGRPMKRGVRAVTLRYKTVERTVEMPGWYCDASDEAIHSGADMAVSDRVLSEMKAEADNLPDASEIRRIRKALGLTQKDAGLIIGGGPKAFQKYESGDIAPSRAIASALRLLERHPTEVDLLRRYAS